MRGKRQSAILTFQTTTQAIAFEKQCKHHNIPGRLVPIPKEITAGCGLSWSMDVEEYAMYQQTIQELQLRFEQAVML